MKSAASTAAFSLIELMVVLALIAIMTALILPELRGTMDDALLRTSARQLVHACDVANSRAIALNEPQRLRLEPSSGRYFVESALGPSASLTRPPLQPSAGTARAPVQGVIDSRITVVVDRATRPEAGRNERSAVESTRRDDPALDDPASDPNSLAFQPDGTASGPDVLLQDRAGFRLALRLNPVTARMRLIEVPRP